MKSFSFCHLDDHALDRDFDASLNHLWSTNAVMLAYLAEFDARKRFAPAGYPSMFSYCVARGFTDDMAAKSIQAARVARQFPAIFPALAERRLSLSAVVFLAPHLFPETADELLEAAANKTCAEIRLLIAARRPMPDAPTLPQQVTLPAAGDEHATQHVGEHDTQHATQHVPAPALLGRPARRIELPESLEEQITYARALMPQAGSVVEVLERAMKSLIAELEKRKFGAGTRTRPRRNSRNPRYVPPEVRKAVFVRDGGQCTFVSDTDHRCESRQHLEYDHINPVAKGGKATVDDMRLLCRAHNQYAAECEFGAGFMERKRQEAKARVTEEQNQDLIPYLRALGFRDREAREGARHCEAIADAPIEARMKRALQYLAPNARRSGAQGALAGSPA